MSKFLDKTGLTHFWGKIKTLLAGKADKEELNGINELVNDFNGDIANLYNTKADEDHIHPNSVKIETSEGDVVSIYGYTDAENGDLTIETGRLHSTSVISTESSIYAEGNITADGSISEGGVPLEEKYTLKGDSPSNDKISQEVICDHVGEITGNTNDEHGLAIDDQQMLLTKIEGQTLIANNLAAIEVNSQTVSGVTFTVNKNNGTILANGTATADVEFRLSPDKSEDLKAKHKYLIWGGYTGGSNSTCYFGSAAYAVFRDFGGGSIGVRDTLTQWQRMAIVVKSGQTVNNVLFKPQLIDLTLMFGYGNEPTLDEWKAMNMPLIPYSTGYILNSKANLISTTKNICPKGQWLPNTRINSSNGSILPRAQNFNLLNVKIPVVYGVKYYFWGDLQYSSWLAYWFDSNEKYLGFSDVGATSFVTPLPNSAYMIINTYTTASLYDPNSTPTEYNVTPFVRITEPLPHQSSELVIDEELGSWEYIDNLTNTKHSKVKSIDLGTLNWTYFDGYKGFYTNDISGIIPSEIRPIDGVSVSHHLYMEKYTQVPDDIFIVSENIGCDFQFTMNMYGLFKVRNLSYTNASQLKAALSGVMLYYESNEEVVTLLETTIADGMTVWNGGQQIQQGQLPYKLTKQYSLSLGSQVLANIQIDKEQQAQINDIANLYNTKADTDYVDTSCGGVYDLLYDEIDGVRNALVTCDATVGGLVDSVSDLEDGIADLWSEKADVQHTHQFKILTRKTATTNAAVDLSSYINNANYSELMIIVRTQATAAVTLGISNTTNATTSNFIASKSLSNGTSYTKIMLEKTDEGYYMWDVNGSIGFSNDATYKYIRNYSTTSNAVTSMSIVIHGR